MLAVKGTFHNNMFRHSEYAEKLYFGNGALSSEALYYKLWLVAFIPSS
jgi:hypothetical protein